MWDAIRSLGGGSWRRRQDGGWNQEKKNQIKKKHTRRTHTHFFTVAQKVDLFYLSVPWGMDDNNVEGVLMLKKKKI